MYKKILLIGFFISSVTISGLISCKKSNSGDQSSALKNQIIGKWTYLKNVNHSVVGGQSDTETENNKPGNYLEFNTDGTIAAVLDDGPGSGTWQIVNSTVKFNFLNGTFNDILFDITNITGNSCTLYAKSVTGSDYYETTIYLSR